jgi:hypothetical protein
MDLKTNREVLLHALRNNGMAIMDVSEKEQDFDIVHAAVSSCGRALLFAPAAMKANYDIVLSAVTQNGDALQFASAELKDDVSIVTAAVTQNGNALFHASESSKDNGHIVLLALSNSTHALRMCSIRLRKGGLQGIIDDIAHLRVLFYVFVSKFVRLSRKPWTQNLPVECLKHVADFLGVPRGIKFKHLCRAASVLQRPL